MIVIDNLSQVANQIETERGVSKEILFQAIEQALVSAARKKLHNEEIEIEANLNYESGEIKIYIVKEVVTTVEDEDYEISLKDAKKLDKKASLELPIKVEMKDPTFGRIAAQTAKQVIIQRIREAEKDSVYEEFKQRENQVITGTVQRIENNNYLINLGRTEAILSYREQIPGETFKVKEKIKIFVAGIEKGPRGNRIIISRTHPGLLKCLFEVEIPEIQDGIIEIMSISREPGKRAKVAVKTNNPTIGAVGTCVGQMGGRIQSIIKEIGNEKIDVLEWDENPKKFIANALKPAQISQVIISSEEEKEAIVVVPSDQLSLAIGKQGINVRLCVKLTGWKLDILNEEEFEKKREELTGEKALSLVEKMKLEKEKSLAEENSSEDGAIQATDETSSEDELTKVSDLAKEMKLKTQELIDLAATHNIEIKNNRAKLSAAQVSEIKEKCNS